MTILDSALKYESMGFSVIPVKLDKHPYITWGKYQQEKPTPDQIKEWWAAYPNANVAIITGKISKLGVVDVDSEGAKEKFDELLPNSFLTPIAKTPHNGLHYYFQSENGLGNSVGFMDKTDFRGEGGYIIAPPSVGYSWLPELSIEKIGLAALPLFLKKALTQNLSSVPLNSYINSLCAHGEEKEGQRDKRDTNVTSVTGIPVGRRDDVLFHLANYLVKSGMPVKEIEYYLMLLAMRGCEKPYPLEEAKVKIQSALKRREKSEKPWMDEIRELINVTSGDISVTYTFQNVTSVTRQTVRQCLHRLEKEGILERTGKRAGEYRKVESQFEVVDFSKVTGKPIDIKLPLEIEQFVEIMPKDLIVIAGSPNAGKTALMFEIVRLNMQQHKIWYFSTEMGRYNCKRRLAKHEYEDNWDFNFVDDFPNYLDVIQPDNFNIIDYVEVAEGEYYKIPSILAGIQKRLQNGVAIVALQKDPSKSYGVGGEQTKAKPALFMTIDADYPGAILRIEKAKNYKDMNPYGYRHRIKIVRGINIIADGVWGRDD